MQEIEDSSHRLESLHNSVDEKLGEIAQKEFQEMKDQLTQLEDRWTRFRRKLTASIEDNKRMIRRQREFDQEHMKICSVLETVLQGTENTGFDQTDMAVDLDRVEVFIIPLIHYLTIKGQNNPQNMTAYCPIGFLISLSWDIKSWF